jgi:hypothetical protein
MLSLENCRNLLGRHGDELDDADIKALRDEFYSFATLSIEVFSSVGYGKKSSTFHDALALFEESQRDYIAERAAVIEFEAKIERETAERIAIGQAIKDWNN